MGGSTLSNPALIEGSPFMKQLPGRPNKILLMKLFKFNVLNQNPLGMVLSNVKYSEHWFLIIPFLAGMHEVSVEQVVELLKEFTQQPPSADAVLEKLKPLDVEQIEVAVDEYLYQSLKQHPRFRGKMKQKKTLLAIDLHDEPYYGESQSEYIITGKRKEGTNRFFRFATAYICEDGYRYNLGVKMVKKGDKVAEIALKMIEQAQRLVKIGLVVLDGGFYDTNLVKELDRRGIRFLIRGSMNEPAKRLVRENNLQSLKEGEGKFFKHTMRCDEPGRRCEHEVRLLICRRYGELTVLATNRGSRREVEEMIAVFNSRFGIESSYRDGRRFRCRTTSNRDNFRAAMFFVGIILQNLLTLFLSASSSEGRTPPDAHRMIHILVLRTVLCFYPPI
jgi:hypothetical protein